MMRLIPQDLSFFEMLEASARRALEAARGLERLIGGDATEVGPTTQLIDKLNRTFVTPLDREDIHAVAFEIDDIVDAILTAADRITIYHVEDRASHVPALMALLLEACTGVDEGVRRLRTPKEIDAALATCRRIHRAANQADQAMHAALADLFATPPETPQAVLEMIKAKEVYDHLKQAIDACEDVADRLHGVVVKNA